MPLRCTRSCGKCPKFYFIYFILHPKILLCGAFFFVSVSRARGLSSESTLRRLLNPIMWQPSDIASASVSLFHPPPCLTTGHRFLRAPCGVSRVTPCATRHAAVGVHLGRFKSHHVGSFIIGMRVVHLPVTLHFFLLISEVSYTPPPAPARYICRLLVAFGSWLLSQMPLIPSILVSASPVRGLVCCPPSCWSWPWRCPPWRSS